MNKPFLFHPASPALRVRVTREMHDLPPALDAMVEEVWQSELLRLPGMLFNGRVFSTDHIAPDLLGGHWTEYRRVVAQMRRPELFAELGVRPTAVGGVITCPDGVLFGRRPRLSVYQAGEWQLPPAGSVDPSCARAEGWVDVVAMLLTELAEEIGLQAHDVSNPCPLGMVEHAGSHVLDLGIALTTPRSATEILAIHAASGNGEYDPLMIVPHAELQAFLMREKVTLQAPLFLAETAKIRTDSASF